MLTGILVRFEPNKLVMAATDSYRLAVKETPVEATLPELEAIIPARALQELARIAAGADDIQLGMHDNHAVFGAEGVAHDAPHRRAVPELPPAVARAIRARGAAPRDEALEVVRRVSLMAQRNSPLRLHFADGELTVSAITQDVGEARESLPAPYTADALEIGFNASFFGTASSRSRRTRSSSS